MEIDTALHKIPSETRHSASCAGPGTFTLSALQPRPGSRSGKVAQTSTCSPGSIMPLWVTFFFPCRWMRERERSVAGAAWGTHAAEPCPFPGCPGLASHRGWPPAPPAHRQDGQFLAWPGTGRMTSFQSTVTIPVCLGSAWRGVPCVPGARNCLLVDHLPAAAASRSAAWSPPLPCSSAGFRLHQTLCP